MYNEINGINLPRIGCSTKRLFKEFLLDTRLQKEKLIKLKNEKVNMENRME